METHAVAGGRQQAADRGHKAVWRLGRMAAALALLAMLISAGGVALLAQQQPQRTPAQEGFLPVDKLPTAQEQLPAAPLVMAAYAVAWVAVFGYLISLWTRLGRVEREIQAVSRRVEAGSRR